MWKPIRRHMIYSRIFFSVCAVSLLLVCNGASASVGQQSFGLYNNEPKQAQLDVVNYRQEISTAQDKGPLPGDADVLKEAFGDWAIECKAVDMVKRCVMGQYQVDKATGNEIISISIYLTGDGSARAVVMLPLGLAIDKGAKLTWDDSGAYDIAPFVSCVPEGCIASLLLSDSRLAALEQTKSFSISVSAFGSLAKPTFTIPLDGFSEAREELLHSQ
ncbi:invasion associated locus B family protein [Rhizobium sp. AG207R]|uniref:invasion associated locus B family protein n=1 Tax=Rhizobium sp. AG207R TaxID=2802287 RepID=UPI0022AC33FA|nr:invasion associated locus B family protein [Rhizobium sp. AG207R]MCZ3378441.1 invasion associated locus B family protein [Rhizobium sp. AG207R]